MNHCLAQIFCVCLPLRLTNRDFVRRPVILQNQWMVNGNVCGPLFKITYRIAARGHDVPQELVSLGYRASGAVNESRLDPAPGLQETHPITGSEWSDR